MIPPIAVGLLSCCRAVWESVWTLGFLTGVACSFIVLLICWIIEFTRRMRRKNKVLRVVQADGGELVLTYKAIRTHVRLLLEREFGSLALKGIDINGGAEKSLRLHVVASEGARLSEIRGKVCNRLSRSFKEDLGLADTIKGISVDVEEFRKANVPEAEAVEKPAEEPAAEKQELVVPPLPPEDLTPLAVASQKQDGGNDSNGNNGGKKHKG